jgi:hypothetical protein
VMDTDDAMVRWSQWNYVVAGNWEEQQLNNLGCRLIGGYESLRLWL